MTENPNEFLRLIQSGWPQVLAIFAIIWWSRKVDLRTQDHTERLDRHESRLQGVERGQQDQAVRLARIEEALSGIKLTLDRIYSEVREKT